MLDPENTIVKLCSQGMELEGMADADGASKMFGLAWEVASNDLEKSIAAHYVARHQPNSAQKLHWDLLALKHALKVEVEQAGELLPSLYLNVGKCHEDLGRIFDAKANYELAFSYTGFLPDDGFGRFVKNGILNGLNRVDTSETTSY